jgi:hypothetical protein
MGLTILIEETEDKVSYLSPLIRAWIYVFGMPALDNLNERTIGSDSLDFTSVKVYKSVNAGMRYMSVLLLYLTV